MTEHDSDREAVDRWMQRFSAEPAVDSDITGAALIWWKAQLLNRLESERRVTSILDAGWRLATGAASVACLCRLGWAWPGLTQSGASPIGAPVALIGTVSLLLATMSALVVSDGRGGATRR